MILKHQVKNFIIFNVWSAQNHKKSKNIGWSFTNYMIKINFEVRFSLPHFWTNFDR